MNKFCQIARNNYVYSAMQNVQYSNLECRQTKASFNFETNPMESRDSAIKTSRKFLEVPLFFIKRKVFGTMIQNISPELSVEVA